MRPLRLLLPFVAIAAALAQPGDLLFYATDPSDPATIHHVTLFMGDGRMVEAPYTGEFVRVRPVPWDYEELVPLATRPGTTPNRVTGVAMPDPSVPASTTPVQDYLDRPARGATEDHLVIPRSLAQSMPLRWQQVFVGLLADLHDAYEHLPWPDYRVVPSRWELLVDLDEEQLAAAGFHADLGADGGLEYRDAADRLIPDPEQHRVLAPVDDPLPPASAGRVEPRPAAPL